MKKVISLSVPLVAIGFSFLFQFNANAQGALAPTGAPSPTQKSLQEIWDSVQGLKSEITSLRAELASNQSYLQNQILSDLIYVQGGILPNSSQISGQAVGSFYIGRTEVTYAEWKKVRDYGLANGYSFDNEGSAPSDMHPVGDVSWYDVVKWCNAKSQQMGLSPVYFVNSNIYKTGKSSPIEDITANGFRIPKDAEWEWAARGGVNSNGFTYSGSNTPTSIAWFSDNSNGALVSMNAGKGTWPVGTKAANELGIFDMSGNVEEWISDYADIAPSRRVRGGNWEDPSNRITVADRGHGGNADYAFNVFGFRLAKNK
jgi:sulfatase modifying factor 1